MNEVTTLRVNIGLVKRPNPPVREHFDEQEMERLVTSIRENGILVPLMVVQRGDEYEVIDGDRRLNAAWKADLREVPVMVHTLDAQQVHIQRMLANLDRHDPDPVSEAKYCARVIADGVFTFEELAAKLGRTEEWVASRITIAEMPEYMQRALSDKAISLGVCLQLNQIKEENTKQRYFQEALRNGMSVHSATYNRMMVNEAIEANEASGTEVTPESVPVDVKIPMIQCALTDEHLPINEMRMVRVGIKALEIVRKLLKEEA
jgi:ParB family chromosome partitioning protein